eukprot:SAG31_NODE_1494_length_8106_cov_7.933183_9_plen_137_part_00
MVQWPAELELLRSQFSAVCADRCCVWQVVSLSNELEVYRQLISACDTLLKNYPTTALVDQAIIQNTTTFAALSERQQTALVTRFSEKRVLHQTIQLVSRAWSNILIEGWCVHLCSTVAQINCFRSFACFELKHRFV